MSERYTKLFTLPARLYAEGSPVIITAGALSKDNDTGRVFAQLRFRNISNKSIKALSIFLACYYPFGEQADDVVKYQYLDLDCNVGCDFGAKTPIVFSDKGVRSFSVHVDKIVYSDNSVSEINLDYSETLPIQILLKNAVGWNYDTALEFAEMTNSHCVYKSIDYKDLWLCSCGGVNKLGRDRACRKCSIAKDKLLSITPEKAIEHKKEKIYKNAVFKMNNSDISVLTTVINELSVLSDWKDSFEKIEECKRKIEQINREKEEEKTVEEKHRKKIIKISACTSGAAVACICLILLVAMLIVPAIKYNKAIKLMESDSYTEAIEKFNSLKDFKDSNDKAKECTYLNAVKNMEKGNYTDAITVLSSLGDYKDSSDKIKECTYGYAEKLFADGKYSEASEQYTSLKDYKDCQDKAKECQYNEALNFMEEEKYDEASDKFSSLGDYKDSSEQVDNCGKEKYGEDKWNKIKNLKVGDYITFGSYEQDNNISNGKENIEWQVLDRKDNKVLLISKYALDSRSYNSEYTSVTWETCTLRKWLNGEFFNSAFSADEQAEILDTKVTADENPNFDSYSGKDTTDKIFLLNITEIVKYFSSQEARRCVPTAYAIEQGAWLSSDNRVGGKSTCWWWLRTTGELLTRTVNGNSDGSVYYRGSYVGDSDVCVRPALWIDLEK